MAGPSIQTSWQVISLNSSILFLFSPSQGQRPNVVPLQIHLPNEQRIVFDPSLNARHIVECGENSDTPLLAFFKANQRPGPVGNLAWSLTYQEFPKQFTLKSIEDDPHSKTWSHRQTGFAIGCMIHVGPTAGEKFYLRTLLMVVKGPTSFEDLRTVDGMLCGSFHEACLKWGLLEDDGE